MIAYHTSILPRKLLIPLIWMIPKAILIAVIQKMTLNNHSHQKNPKGFIVSSK